MIVRPLEVMWYTEERELPVICRVADWKQSFKVLSLRLQLDYEAQVGEAIIWLLKYIGL